MVNQDNLALRVFVIIHSTHLRVKLKRLIVRRESKSTEYPFQWKTVAIGLKGYTRAVSGEKAAYEDAEAWASELNCSLRATIYNTPGLLRVTAKPADTVYLRAQVAALEKIYGVSDSI